MIQPDNMHALLQWYIAAGVDEAIDSAPQNRFVQAPKTPPATAPETTPAAAPITAPARATPPVSVPNQAAAATNTPSEDTRELAAGCASFDELRAAIGAFDGCALKRTATNTVVGTGDEAAALMVVGEAPGGEEDRRGLPFVGPAGKLLDRMLAAIGLERSAVYITNILPWRPPGNRSPTAEEIALCQPFVERQIELVQPKILVLVGGISAKSLLDKREGITRLRGTWREFSVPALAEPIATMATFHPAYLLRQPAAKKEVWRDLLAIQQKLAETPDMDK